MSTDLMYVDKCFLVIAPTSDVDFTRVYPPSPYDFIRQTHHLQEETLTLHRSTP